MKRKRKRKKRVRNGGDKTGERRMILFYSRIIEYEQEDRRKRVIFQVRIAEYRKAASFSQAIRPPAPSGLPRGKLNIRAVTVRNLPRLAPLHQPFE